METQTQIEKSPPDNNPPVALDLGEPQDWHLQILMAQILGPIHRLIKILDAKKILK